MVWQGKSAHSKQSLMPLLNAQAAILHILFSLGMHPCSPLGHNPLAILGHFSQAIPQTPIFMLHPSPLFSSCPKALVFIDDSLSCWCSGIVFGLKKGIGPRRDRPKKGPFIIDVLTDLQLD